jgi:hypothetical protein
MGSVFFLFINQGDGNMPELEDTELKPQSIVKNLIAANTPPKGGDNPKPEEEIINNEEEIQSDETSAKGKEDESKVEDSLITDELVKLLNLPKGFVGQPLSSIGKSYRQSLTWGNENNKKLIQLETKVQTLEGQLSESQIKKTEQDANKETTKQLGKPPDPVNEPDEFAAWLEKRDSIMEEKFTKILEKNSQELLKSVDENPHLKQAQEIALEKSESMFYTKLQDGLPKGMSAEDVFNAWFEDNEEDYSELCESGVYKNRPQKLVKDVLTWLKALSYDSVKNQKESDVIKKIHKNTKANLERIGKHTNAIDKFTQTNREEKKPESIAGRIVASLEKNKRVATG